MSKSNEGVVMGVFVQAAIGWVLLVGVLVWVFRPRGRVVEDCESGCCQACAACEREYHEHVARQSGWAPGKVLLRDGMDADTAGELMTEAYVEDAEDAAERAFAERRFERTMDAWEDFSTNGANGRTWCKACGQWEECG